MTSKIFGTNEALIIEDETDSDGELELHIPIYADDIESACTWLNEAMALDVIKHLVKVFGMSGLQAAVDKYEAEK